MYAHVIVDPQSTSIADSWFPLIRSNPLRSRSNRPSVLHPTQPSLPNFRSIASQASLMTCSSPLVVLAKAHITVQTCLGLGALLEFLELGTPVAPPGVRAMYDRKISSRTSFVHGLSVSGWATPTPNAPRDQIQLIRSGLGSAELYVSQNGNRRFAGPGDEGGV